MLNGIFKVFLGIVLTIFSLPILAEEIRDYYSEPGMNPFKEGVNHLENELIDPFSGTLQLTYRDLFVPGNGGMDISVYRSYTSLQTNEYPKRSQYGVGWVMHMGRIVVPKIYKDRVCRQASFVDATKDNPSFELPSGGRELLFQTDTSSNDLITKSNWKMSCDSSTGLKTVTSPDGTRYEMGHYQFESNESDPSWFTSKIIDVHGNSITINYDIVASGQSYITDIARGEEGEKVVEFSYISVNGEQLLSQISANGQVVNYEYSDKIPGFLVSKHNLIKVIRSDEKFWEYFYNGKITDPYPNDDINEDGLGSYSLNQVKLPNGAEVNYEYQFVKFYENYEKKTTSISKKIVTGSDIENGTWAYSFDPHSSNLGLSVNDVLFDKTTIIGPDKKKEYYHFGTDKNSTETGQYYFPPSLVGLLVHERTYNLNNKLLEKTYKNWGRRKISDERFWHAGPNYEDWGLASYAPVLLGEYLDRDGVEGDGYSRIVRYSNHDNYGNPATIIQHVNLGGFEFSEIVKSIEYYNNEASWILGLVSKETKKAGEQEAITQNTYDMKGNILTSMVNGLTTAYTYHSNGDLSSVTDPKNNTVYYSNYKRGIAGMETHPEGISITRSINDTGTISSETNANGNTTSYKYDSANRITSIEHPLNNRVSMSYRGNSRTLIRGNFKQISRYDSLGRTVSENYSDTNSGDTIKKVFKFDALGRIIFESNPSQSTSVIGKHYEYDALGRRTKTTYQDGSIYKISYDDITAKHTDELGRETTYTSVNFGLDPGMLYQIIQPSGVSTIIYRNMQGQPTQIFQGSPRDEGGYLGWDRTYTYDAQFNLSSERDPESGIRSYSYDNNGNRISETLADESIKTFQYDDLNRLTSIDYANDPSIAYEYSLASELKTIANGNSIRRYVYNENGSLTSESLEMDDKIYSTNYVYDDLDNLTSMTYPTGRIVDYSPNAFGWATQVAPFITSVDYHPSGQLAGITYANGKQSTFTLSDRLWIDKIQTNDIFTHDYAYDVKGNVLDITATGLTPYSRSMTYDLLDRLDTATGPWGTINYGYNATGDITSNENGTFNYSGVRLNSIEKDKIITSFLYDNNGNVTEDKKILVSISGGGPSLRELHSRNYLYDDAENLIRSNSKKLSESFGVVTHYQYDGKGNRIRKYSDTSSTDFVYSDSGLLLGEYTAAGLEYGKDLIYLGTQLVSSIQKNQIPDSSASSADALIVEGNSTTLNGSARDPDGTQLNYLWSQTSGTTAVISDPTSLNTSVLAPSITGTQTLIFQLTVTDSDKESHSSIVSIQVISDDYDSENDGMSDAWELQYFGTTDRNGSEDFDNDGQTDAQEFANGTDPTAANQLPTAHAGTDTLVIAKDNVTLSGVLSNDGDGSITQYQWTQVSGTSVAILDGSTANASFTAPSVVDVESLQFKLTVIDNEFGTNEDNVSITVISETYDSEPDGMPDAWELRTFGDISRDGTLDSDGDGISDLAEYTANSNPNDSAPTVEITYPTAEIEILSSTAYVIRGTAIDAEDGELSNNIQWISNLIGPIGNGAELSIYLTEGIHTITATVTDSENGQPQSSPSISVFVIADTDGDQLPDDWETHFFGTLDYDKSSDPDEDGISNFDEYQNDTHPMDQAPTITILAPTNDSLQKSGNALALVSEVLDREDGNISHQVTWVSNVDGILGTGALIPVHLSTGYHALQAYIQDSAGGKDTASIGVNISDTGCIDSISNNVRHQQTLFNSGLDTPSLAASSNGQHVLFYTGVDNALEGDANGQYDLYLLNQSNGQEELISKTYLDTGSNNVPRDLSISNDGNIVSFSSEASDLVANDTNGLRDVFYRNRATGETKRASVDASGNELTPSNGSFGNVVSGDGTKIAFFTNADMDSKDKYGWFDVYLKDLATGAVELVSLDDNENHQFANYDYYYLACSDDCGVVAYAGTAPSAGGNGTYNLYVRDRNTGATQQISNVPSGTTAGFGSFVPAMSADGQIIVYQSEINGLITADQNSLKDIFAYDRQTGITTLVSKNTAGEAANDASFKPSVSADGRYVSFESMATNLDSDLTDTNNQADVFVHDRQTGTTERLSKDWEGNEGVGDYEPAFNPYMLKDGSGVLYRSSINITPDSESWGWNLYTSTLPMCLSGNTAPIVQITAPTVPLTIATGSALELSAQAIDNEDGDLSAQISWASSIDGNLGTGTTINVTLTEGVHTITATVTDNEGRVPDFETTLQVTVTQGGVQ